MRLLFVLTMSAALFAALAPSAITAFALPSGQAGIKADLGAPLLAEEDEEREILEDDFLCFLDLRTRWSSEDPSRVRVVEVALSRPITERPPKPPRRS
jgi:hypothetical protein